MPSSYPLKPLISQLFFKHVLILISLITPHYSFGAEFNPKTHIYQIEYVKSVENNYPKVLNVIFDALVDSQKAEEFLKEQLNQAVKYEETLDDIMAIAWYLKPNQEVEKKIKLRDGSTYLLYNHKTREILTGNNYEASLIPKTEPNKEIAVFFDIKTTRSSKGEIKIICYSNLPNGMELSVGLRYPNINYYAQDSVVVINGYFETAWFNNEGKALPAGKYEIEISSILSELQPKSVKQVIGERGENMTGKSVEIFLGNKHIDYTVSKSIN